MRTRKAKKTSLSLPVQYMLSVDKSLKKISLRKISARLSRMKKAAKATRSSRPTRSRAPRTVRALHAPWTPSWAAIGLLLVGGMTGVALFAEHEPVQRVAADRLLAAEAEPALQATIVSQPGMPQPAMTQSAMNQPAMTSANSFASKAPIADAATAPVVMPQSVFEVPTASNVVFGESIASLEPPTVSITGCLDRAGDQFFLSDTSGDAPKSRSWKSGFLKKRASRIGIVDGGHSLMLTSYVGDRVTATGSLADRELDVRSVRRVAGNCE